MIEARLLPHSGSKDQSFIACAGNGPGRNQCGDVHVGVFDPPASNRPSHAVSHLRADGQDGPRLAMGIWPMLSSLMPNLHGNLRVIQPPSRSNDGVNLHVVPVVSELSVGPSMASGRDGIRNLDSTRNVDAVSHSTITLMPLSLLIKLIPLAGMAGGFVAFAEGGRIIDILISIGGSSTFIGLIGLVKYLVDRNDKRRADLVALSRTDTQLTLEREKLLDAQTVAFLKQSEEFYAFRDKEKQAVIDLQRATIEDRNKTIEHQQTVIAAQAAQLQRAK